MPEDDMWKRFTSPATRVIHFAQEEARQLGQSVVGTEHILLGLVRVGDGVAARVLERLGVSLGRVRHQVALELGKSEVRPVTHAPMSLSHKAKLALEYALEESKELNPMLGLPRYVDTEHLLLGVVREASGTAVQVLRALGVKIDGLRDEVMQQVGLVQPAPGESARPRIDYWKCMTEPAQQALLWAQQEAGQMETRIVGTGHLLLGLLRVSDSIAARVLNQQGVTLERARALAQAPEHSSSLSTPHHAWFALSQSAACAIRTALKEAQELEKTEEWLDRVRPEHLLLALMRDAANTAMKMLAACGILRDELRPQLIAEMRPPD